MTAGNFVVAATVVGSAIALACTASPARALDTLETFDVGATNAEFYLGYAGMGAPGAHRELSNELVLGYGLTDRFSAYLGACVAVDQRHFNGATNLCFGLVATPIDRDHFDLDLALDIGASGNGLGTLSLAPMVELNYDHDPEMSTWGLYVRTGIVAYGQESAGLENADPLDRLVDMSLNPGAYLQLSERFQVLVEYESARGLGSDRDGEDPTHGLALGLNTMVTPAVELIASLHRDIPVGDESAKWGLSLGFVATLPSHR